MKILFILLMLFFYKNCFAEEKKIQRFVSSYALTQEEKMEICNNLEFSDDLECTQRKLRYLFGDNSFNIVKNIDELSKLIIVINANKKEEDYKKLESYFDYPLQFAINNRGDKEYQDIDSHETRILIANNFQDLIKNFNRIFEFENIMHYSKSEIFSQEFNKYFIQLSDNYYINVHYVCDGVENKSDNLYGNAFKDLSLCEKIDFKIKNVLIYIR